MPRAHLHSCIVVAITHVKFWARQVLMGLSVAVGVATAVGLGVAPALVPQIFTRDAQLWPLMRSVAPQARVGCHGRCNTGLLTHVMYHSKPPPNEHLKIWVRC